MKSSPLSSTTLALMIFLSLQNFRKGFNLRMKQKNTNKPNRTLGSLVLTSKTKEFLTTDLRKKNLLKFLSFSKKIHKKRGFLEKIPKLAA